MFISELVHTCVLNGTMGKIIGSFLCIFLQSYTFISNAGVKLHNSGFPIWLHFILGIHFRTDNEPFKVIPPFLSVCLILCMLLCEVELKLFLQAEMKRFTAKIVDMMKQENLYASQGGPIILSQVFYYYCLLLNTRTIVTFVGKLSTSKYGSVLIYFMQK